MRIKILAVVLLMASCTNTHNVVDKDYDIINEIITFQKYSDSTAFLNFKHGTFSYERISTDSIILYYSKLAFGLFAGNQCDYIDSLSISPISEVDGLFKASGYWNTKKLKNLGYIDINSMKDYLIKDTLDKKSYRFNWSNLHKNGVKVIFTISEPVLSKKGDYGMIGIQEFTPSNLNIKILSFAFKNTISILDIKYLTFELLGFNAEFKNDSLVSIEPNGLVVK